MITICRLIGIFGKKVPFVCKSTQTTVRTRFFLSTFERRSIKSYKKKNVYFSNKPENKNPVSKPVDSAKLSETILKKLDDIRRHYTWKGKLLFFSVFAFITMAVSYLYLFGDVMRNKMAEEVTSVASKSLADDQLINDAEQLSKEVLHGILHDSDMKDYSTKFVSSVLSNPETRKSATELILSVLNDEEVLRITTDKLSAILLSLLKSDEIKDIVLSQLETILQDPGVKLSVQKLLYDVTSTPEFKK
uniref:Uncharacterized protein n=1 Tax=Ciona savignyi TaxID=51511 RepID=H2YY22_CIOSA